MIAQFQTATVFFPLGRLDSDFVDLFLLRYTQDISDGVELNGVSVAQTPTESDASLATIFPDNSPLTRYRKASIFDSTLPQIPIYDPAPSPGSDPDPGAVLLGHTLSCGWPVQFLADVSAPPQDLIDAFDGVSILPQ